ncbi:Aquaporin-3 [Smittium mucronatum]|uniref:Aquaporin-3 n=1 Tax=Smittium mucronatum TaxID=133383 RepID=A0A1R0GWF6_9FUNG|nr:Aquaporin-3 [Smittium mucronatum]
MSEESKPVHRDPESGQFEQPNKERMFGFYELRYRFRHYLAEYFGTLLLIFFGNTVVALTVFNPELQPESWLLITIAWGLAVTMGLYVSMGNSGGHLNSAVTISAAVYGKFPWRRVPGYILSQILGALTGAALTYAIYRARFDPFDGGVRTVSGPTATGGIFCTYPDPLNTRWDSFFTEMFLTAVLVFVIQGFFDPKMTPAKGFEPVAVGLLVTVIGMAAGRQTGYAINPARDFGPRVFTAIAGWGSAPFTASGHYFWIPIVAPIVGAVLGQGAYELAIIPNQD